MRKTKETEKPKDESADYFMMGGVFGLVIAAATINEAASLRDQKLLEKPLPKSTASEPSKTEQLPWLFLQSNETPCKAEGQSIPYYLVRSQNSAL
jgi:hypothetical protein